MLFESASPDEVKANGELQFDPMLAWKFPLVTVPERPLFEAQVARLSDIPSVPLCVKQSLVPTLLTLLIPLVETPLQVRPSLLKRIQTVLNFLVSLIQLRCVSSAGLTPGVEETLVHTYTTSATLFLILFLIMTLGE